jgi:hypothetical protein
MIPNAPTTQLPQSADTEPRFFVNAAIDADPRDGDWWLDLGGVDLPTDLCA